MMPVLKDARQEKFCQLRIRGGMKQQDAHYEAGFAFNPGNASKLAAKPHVRARLEELQKEAKNKAIDHAAIDRSWVLIRLMRIVERCMGDKEFTPQAAIRALELLGKEQGMFSDKLKLSGDEDEPIEFIRRVIVDPRLNGGADHAGDDASGTEPPVTQH